MRYFRCLYLFTVNDFKVILIPHTVIGLALASTGPLLTTNSEPSIASIIQRAPAVALWNWLNVLVFNIANQRLPESVIEDSINKPWRPIPSGLITPEDSRRLLMALILFEVCVFTYIGGVAETFIMLALTWMYNDLGGGDDGVLVRHLLNGIGFALHTYASIMMAANENYGIFTTSRETSLSRAGWIWLFMEACIVMTTIHAQDMPDVDGDQKRGRQTVPLLLGRVSCRLTLATAVLVWTIACLWFWHFHDYSIPIWTSFMSLGMEIARRTLTDWTTDADERTYKLWCVWLVAVVGLPFVHTLLEV